MVKVFPPANAGVPCAWLCRIVGPTVGLTLETLANALARNINEVALLEHLCQVQLLSDLKTFNVFELRQHHVFCQ